MTHSSGIGVTEDLYEAFGKARTDEPARFLLIKIVDEELKLVGKHEVGAIEKDAEDLQALLEAKVPMFIAFRTDKENELGFVWSLLSYVPDGSPVKERMLYASTRDNLKKQLGYSYFGFEVHATQPDELKWDALNDAFNRDLSAERELVLTATEREVRDVEAAVVAVGPTTEGVHGVQFPLDAAAQTELGRFRNKEVNLVQLSVDTSKETIELANSGNEQVDGLQSVVSEEEPCFHLYRWTHEFEGSEAESVFFVYSCPDGAPIKKRMLYSTVKAVAVGYCEEYAVKPEHKLEINAAEDWNLEAMNYAAHPPKAKKNNRIKRPTRPGRGSRRLVGK